MLECGDGTLPGDNQEVDWSASSDHNLNMLRSHSSCQDPGVVDTPPPITAHQPGWVWQLSPPPGLLPAYCSSCQGWGSMTLVHLG